VLTGTSRTKREPIATIWQSWHKLMTAEIEVQRPRGDGPQAVGPGGL
jgi:hypothetical protein